MTIRAIKCKKLETSFWVFMLWNKIFFRILFIFGLCITFFELCQWTAVIETHRHLSENRTNSEAKLLHSILCKSDCHVILSVVFLFFPSTSANVNQFIALWGWFNDLPNAEKKNLKHTQNRKWRIKMIQQTVFTLHAAWLALSFFTRTNTT